MKAIALKTLLTLLVAGFILSSQSLKAQNELKPVLKSADVDRFINTYKPMAAEFELLADQFDDEEDSESMTYDAVLKGFESGLDNNEAVVILEKNTKERKKKQSN